MSFSSICAATAVALLVVSLGAEITWRRKLARRSLTFALFALAALILTVVKP
jgi:hypothetical protein